VILEAVSSLDYEEYHGRGNQKCAKTPRKPGELGRSTTQPFYIGYTVGRKRVRRGEFNRFHSSEIWRKTLLLNYTVR